MAPRSREELLSYGVMDPLLEAEIAAHPLRGILPSDPYYGRPQDDVLVLREHRAALLREMHHLRYLPGPIPDEVREEDHLIEVLDGSEITVRVYSPVKKKPAAEGDTEEEGCPLIVMYHEGGWCMGDLSDEEVNCRLFCRELGAVCVNVEYRLAPEHPFPTGLNDCWNAVQWAAENAASLGANPARGFVVGGGSAGGNIAAVVAHLARNAELSPPLTGQYLCVPAIMCQMPPGELPEQYRPEYLSHRDVTPCRDPVLGGGDDSRMNAVLAALQPDAHSPLFVPFRFGSVGIRHAGLPPAYLQLCGLDPLRDEGLIYERVLREEARVPTRLDLYPGHGHYFWMNFPRLEMSRRFVEDTVRGMRWLLERGK